jgi:threonine dehydrogenase-like Zn-dependent dehydrogenase
MIATLLASLAGAFGSARAWMYAAVLGAGAVGLSVLGLMVRSADAKVGRLRQQRDAALAAAASAKTEREVRDQADAAAAEVRHTAANEPPPNIDARDDFDNSF